MSPLDELDLVRTLRTQADRPDLTPIGLDDIKSTARGIQRRRRIGTGLAALAIVAGAAVPGALLLGNEGSRVDDPIDEPAVVQLDYGRVVPLDLRDAEPGEPPATTGFVVDGQTLRLGDLQVDDLGTTQQAVPLGDGWFVQGYVQGEDRYGWILDADGAVTDGFPSAAPAHDPATGRTAYVVREGDTAELVVVDADGVELWRADLSDGTVPRGFAGDDVITLVEPATKAESPTLQRISPDGTATPIGTPPEGFEGLDAATGRVTAQVDVRADNTGCFAVIDVATGQPAWERTCEQGLRDFSPDGRFLSAGPAYRSGGGDPGISVLDATTGETVVDFTAPQGLQFFVIQSAWEDADSLLVSVDQSDGEGPAEYAVLRLDLDGTVELVSEVLPWSENADQRLTLLHPQAQG
ncbi:hypothetical protein [Nocardioides massiliensis]|uniref:PQQ-binding-like beta-propeller repeat protein n=1 Tax=Nocardioides massiliensis TaxID=1325935 RepID=A0ABT9NPS9_9ACTN|nr:hypothetical protein [Nocardioides massiliensis]MDP9822075.1 hypothetical protein [Nocardioides massiliensis]